MTRCRYPDCLRAPAHPGQAYCARHAESVERVPEWRKRLPARDETGRAA